MRIAQRWWRHRRVHRLFGLKFWAFVVGAAPLESELEAFWGELGFVVIQGYGLTETAPIVTLNHPFGTKRGSVGKAIAGVEVKIAPDGEILVRGENVTTGYFNAADETARAFEDGWFHTGDIGEIGEDGQLFIRGRKKEMIVTPEGLNVFPEDVERVLQPPARRARLGGRRRLGARRRRRAGARGARRSTPATSPDAMVRAANAQLADHQRIRRALVWPEPELPRTEGTRKLKRARIRDWVRSGGGAAAGCGRDRSLGGAGREVRRPRRSVTPRHDARRARAELARARRADGRARGRVPDPDRRGRVCRRAQPRPSCARWSTRRPRPTAPPAEPVEFPGVEPDVAGARDSPRQPADLDSAARAGRSRGCASKAASISRPSTPGDLRGQSPEPHGHAGDPGGAAAAAALPGRARHGQGVLQGALFSRSSTDARAWFTNSLNYYLAALFFNAFPLPQREAGARQTLRYIGEVLEDGFSVLIFPGGAADRRRRDRPLPSRHRHDRVAAERAGRAGPDRGARQGAAPHVADGQTRPRPGRLRRRRSTLTGDDYEDARASRWKTAVKGSSQAGVGVEFGHRVSWSFGHMVIGRNFGRPWRHSPTGAWPRWCEIRTCDH